MTIGGNAQQFNRQKPAVKTSKNKFAHTAPTPYGMGDNYGTGVRQKMGRMREGLGMVSIKSKIGTPPKSLA